MKRGLADACTLVEAFEAQAEETPERVAVSIDGDAGKLTYEDLNRQSDGLARRLRAMGAEPESIAGIYIERSPQYLVALLGVLKAGAAFLPLDPRYPRARLDFMLQDSGAKFLVSNSLLAANLSNGRSQTILLDHDDAEMVSNARLPVLRTSLQSLAYVAYTSGSTGKPKGVLCPQLGLVNRLAWMSEHLPYESDEVASQIVALSFVDSVYEIFGPLLNGIELRILPDPVARGSPMELMRAVERNRITRIIVVPSVLAYWLECIACLNTATFPLRYCFVSGEVMVASLAARFREILPNTRLINFYGASELCHHATWFEIVDCPERTVPIGRPIAATEAYLLDSDRKPVPDGASGELYLGGPGMARGYLNQPQLTAERFVENPFDSDGTRLFKTGDLCRYLDDGNLEYLGRIDQQVKIRGCLVEPAEVEAALRSHPAIQGVLAGARPDGSGENRLVAWVILHRQGAVNAADLRHFLEATLPPHLIPAQFVFVSNFPRLPNNKINRRELPNPFETRRRQLSLSSAPRDSLEKRLAAIWEDVLKCGPVNREDNFFDLGGDSLQAALLTMSIEQEFGRMVSAHELLESPTLAQLALAIGEGRAPAFPRHIIPIQPTGSRVRFLCFGGGPALVPLARRLGSDQPVFGIGLDQRDLAWLNRATTLEELVRQMVVWLREFQPQGPYRLGGYSMHGLFAYEAAVQLQAQGQDAEVLLIDTYLPLKARDRCPLSMRTSSHLSSLWQRILHNNPRALLHHAKSLASLSGSYVRRRIWKDAASTLPPREDPEEVFASLLADVEAGYVPQIFSRIRLVEAQETLFGGATGARFGWEYLTGAQVEITSIPGNHNTILTAPYVDHLAREIGEWLERN